MPFKNTHFC